MWLDILSAIQEEQGRKQDVRPSRVQSSANVPYSRFWDCMDEMRDQGLVSVAPLGTTTKGNELLRQSREMRAMLVERKGAATNSE